MRSPTYGNHLYRVLQTSTGLYVEHFREQSRTTLGVVHVNPAFVWEQPNSPYRCSLNIHESELLTRQELAALLELHNTQLHVAMTL